MPDSEPKETTSELRQEAQVAETMDGGSSPAAHVVVKPVRRYRARVFQSYLVAATLIFGLLLYYARHIAYFKFDLKIALWLQEHHTFWLDVLLGAVSQLGFNPLAAWFAGLTILFVFLIGLKWESVMLLVAGSGVGVLNLTLKAFVQRQRPAENLVNVLTPIDDYSFPSGHVLLFTVFLGFLLFLVFTLTPRSVMRTLGLALLSVLIALVGVSRVYMGHHWPSDVIGAYLLGTLWLTLTVYLYRKGKARFFVHQPLAPSEPATVT